MSYQWFAPNSGWLRQRKRREPQSLWELKMLLLPLDIGGTAQLYLGSWVSERQPPLPWEHKDRDGEEDWGDEEEGEWTYSTGSVATTMGILRDRFGEASFRDAPSWQPWAPGADAGAWQAGRGKEGSNDRRLIQN